MSIKIFRQYKMLSILSVVSVLGIAGVIAAYAIADGARPSYADSTINAVSTGSYWVNITSSGEVNLNLTPTVDGTLNVGKDDLLVKTNVNTGYKLFVSMANNDANGNRLYRNNDKTGASGYVEPTTGTSASPKAMDIDTWGYAVAKTATGATNTHFDDVYSISSPSKTSKWAAVPLSSSPAQIQQIGTASTDGTKLEVYYAVNSDLALAAGTYSNTVTYTATAETPAETATISPTTGYVGDTVTITTPLTTTADLGTVTATIGGQNCTDLATSRGASDNLIVTCKVPTLTDGKHDVVVSIPKFGQQYTIAQGFTYEKPMMKMQEMTSTYCSSMTEGESVQMQDDRGDKQIYTIKKLKDKKCWMTENLRLGGSTAINLTTSDTNITSDWTLPASGTANFYLTNGYTNAAMNSSKKTTTQAAKDSSPAGIIGNFYNYCAASAGTYCYASGSGTGNAEHDICPKGWRMPTGGSSGEYKALYTAYSSNQANFQAALATPLSGHFYDGSVRDQGGNGYFWSSTRYNGSNMYILIFSSSNVNPANNRDRYYGYSVRCVAQ